MATTAAQTQTGPFADPAQLWNAIVTWLRNNSKEAANSALLGGLFGYAANFLMILFVFDGYAKFDGSGNVVSSLMRSTLFWGIASTVFFGLIGYRRAVGKERFWQDIRTMPATIEMFFRQDGKFARVHLLWGAAASFLAMQVISPWIGAVIAVGLLSALPSLLGRILSHLFLRVCSTVIQLFAPKQGQSLGGSMAMIVAMVGASAALVIGFFITGSVAKLGLALTCAVAAWLLAREDNSPNTRHLFLFFLLPVLYIFLRDWLEPLIAFAHDGGFWENHGKLSGADVAAVGGSAIPGGLAAAAGSPVGAALGGLLGVGSGGGSGNLREPPDARKPNGPTVASRPGVSKDLPRVPPSGERSPRPSDGKEPGGSDGARDASPDRADGEEPGDESKDKGDKQGQGKKAEGGDKAADDEAKRIANLVNSTRGLISGVDPARRQFLEDFLNRHAKPNANGGFDGDPDAIRRAHDAIRSQTFDAQQQRNRGEAEEAGGEAAALGASQQYTEDVRDWSMRVNRGLAHLDPTGTGNRIVNAQGIAYGGAQGYEEDGLRGAIGRSAAGALDNYTAGAGSTIYEGSREGASVPTMGGNYVDNIRDQYDPGRIASRLGDAVATAEQGGGIGKLVDGVLDTVDAGRDLHDRAKSVKDRFGDSEGPTHPDGDPEKQRRKPGAGEADEPARTPGEEEAAAPRKAEAEAEAKRKADEAEAKRKADEEEAQRKATEEQEAKRKADEEAEAKRKADEAEAKRKADEEEAQAKQKADEEASVGREMEEARRRAIEAKRKLQEQQQREQQELQARQQEEQSQKQRQQQQQSKDQRPDESFKDWVERIDAGKQNTIEILGGEKADVGNPVMLDPRTAQHVSNLTTQPAVDPQAHEAALPGLYGEHSNFSLQGNPNGQIRNDPYTTNAGVVITDPFEASLARHAEAKPADTPWMSFTNTRDRATLFNSAVVAQVDMPKSQLDAMFQAQKAGRVDYAAMKNDQYKGEMEVCLNNVPAENFRVTRTATVDPPMTRESSGPMAGYDFYTNADGEKVYRLYRGLHQHNLPPGTL